MKRAVAGVVVLLCGCGPFVDVIDHGEGGGGDDGADGADDADDAEDGADDGTLQAFENFPEPATSVCGALPEGVTAIDGLVTAHVVTGARAPDVETIDVVAATPRLRLAAFGLPTDATYIDVGNGDPECGPQSWMFAFDLPLELAPGVFELAAITPSLFEAYEGYPDGCGFGGTPVGGGLPLGEIEIFTVTDTCVTGEIRGADESFSPAMVKNGGFVAQRAALLCVPVGRSSCL